MSDDEVVVRLTGRLARLVRSLDPVYGTKPADRAEFLVRREIDRMLAEGWLRP